MASLGRLFDKSMARYVKEIIAVDLVHSQQTISCITITKEMPNGIMRTIEIQQPLEVSLSYTCISSNYHLLNTQFYTKYFTKTSYYIISTNSCIMMRKLDLRRVK